MKFLRYSINDDVWNFYLVPEDDTTTLDNMNAEAEVDFDNREVHIMENHLGLTLILHELWHIHTWYCFLFSTSMNSDDMEEVGAELFSRRGEHITKQAKIILSKLEELKINDED
jgi:hypothetical protein